MPHCHFCRDMHSSECVVCGLQICRDHADMEANGYSMAVCLACKPEWIDGMDVELKLLKEQK